METLNARDVLREARAYLKWIQSFGMYTVPDEAFDAAGAPRAASGDRGGAVPPPPGGEHHGSGGPLSGEGTKDERLDRLTEMVKNCTRCRLCEQALNGVFGEGNRSARLMFIGEAPGATEDKMGRPFVGAAGRVLTEELARNGITREEVFITNLVKHRPPGNRDPLPDEIEACQPYLHEQIDLIQPRLICGLGRFACGALLGEPIRIMQIRGTWREYRGVPLFICLHPSAVLHQKNNRALFDQDIATLAKAYHDLK